MASTPQGSGGSSPQPSPTFSAAPTAHSIPPSARPCTATPACYEWNERKLDDASKDLSKPCHGWPQLVHDMVENPGFESFQSFRDLNIKSLLYYQAELDQLRKDLHALEWKDHRNGGQSAVFCENIRSLLLTKRRPEECQEQLSKVKEMREVLKEYNAALLQYAEINKLPKVEKFNFETLCKWLHSNRSTSLLINGPGEDSWGDRMSSQQTHVGLWGQFWKLLKSIVREERSKGDYLDLVVPRKEEDIDSLTRWVASQGTPFWHNLKIAFKKTSIYNMMQPKWQFLCTPFRHKGEERTSEEDAVHNASAAEKGSADASISSALKRGGFEEEAQVKSGEKRGSLSTYSMNRMIRFTNFVATIIACLLPIVGIVVLSELHTKAKTLGFIALFTAIFAIGIMVLTDKRTSRTEVFTATAAFAAVLVVFVQNQSPASVSG